jgi:hydrogenase expression/formation protein HypD
MKYLDEYRDSATAIALAEKIRKRATRPWTLMEVCGGQTHNLLRYGIDELLDDVIELIHGPGCPVCVTSLNLIDRAMQIAARPDTILVSFGDMLRVPGSSGSLLDARTRGGSVRMVYSPLDAVELARQEPNRQIVFFAVGFETTAPATALAVKQAVALGLHNFTVLVSHVRVQPAMEKLLQLRDVRIDGFLAAGHVCTVAGYQTYDSITEKFAVPVVVTGFELVDLLSGILACVSQLEEGTSDVQNCYGRSVREQGNQAARQLVDDVYEACDRDWRGFGVLPLGGLRLRAAWRSFDAAERFGAGVLDVNDTSDCPSGLVLAGRMKPNECRHFGTTCTPDHPLGAPMVSSEGACAAYYRYRGASPANVTVRPLT